MSIQLLTATSNRVHSFIHLLLLMFMHNVSESSCEVTKTIICGKCGTTFNMAVTVATLYVPNDVESGMRVITMLSSVSV